MTAKEEKRSLQKGGKMSNNRAKIRWLVLVMVISSTILSSSCASLYHRVLMKGSIIETSDSEIYLCIGKKDGASVGQELNIYKIILTTIPKQPPTFRREITGKARITEIIDEHFAKAKIISGKAEKNYIVELDIP